MACGRVVTIVPVGSWQRLPSRHFLADTSDSDTCAPTWRSPPNRPSEIFFKIADSQPSNYLRAIFCPEECGRNHHCRGMDEMTMSVKNKLVLLAALSILGIAVLSVT